VTQTYAIDLMSTTPPVNSTDEAGAHTYVRHLMYLMNAKVFDAML
jgi:hypothetical protein